MTYMQLFLKATHCGRLECVCDVSLAQSSDHPAFEQMSKLGFEAA